MTRAEFEAQERTGCTVLGCFLLALALATLWELLRQA